MSWDSNIAKARIQTLMDSVPDIAVESFEETYLPRFLSEQQLRKSRGLSEQRPLVDLPNGKAVVLDTVQVYVNLINYDEYRLQEGHETAASHARALDFLHLHYGACDRVIGALSAQRVDFHGPRVHAVVINTPGAEGYTAGVLEAIRLAKQMMLLSDLANSEIAENNFTAQIRIGIDTGRCVAINSGNGVEQEPLFLGSAANHAAKLAEGNEPGIFVSDNVRSALNQPQVGSFDAECRMPLIDEVMRHAFESSNISSQLNSLEDDSRGLLQEWKADIEKHSSTNGGFKFHYQAPPLSEVEFADLSPANSIRMPLISIFADLDGYTRYIDKASESGGIAHAVKALHVIRGEFQNVLESDFGGKKVRFVGDCVHGLIAEGNSTSTDHPATVRTAATCAGAMRSSFLLCQEALTEIDDLGLAIGFELGETPVSRIGIRGDRSVRVASSEATILSETLQKSCNGEQTAIGPCAMRLAPLDIQTTFSGESIITDLEYSDISILSSGHTVPAQPASSEPFRAHCVKKSSDQ